VLDPGIVLKAILREVFSVARVTETTVRHFCRQRDVGVDPNATKVECFGKAKGSGVVGSPNR
jgi:hypothetical protein